MFLVCLPEEASVIKAGAQHSFIAVANQALRIAVRVQHGKEVGKELAISALNREIFLMIAHDGDQYFFGEFKKTGIEATENCRWPFGEIHNCIQQSVVVAPACAWDRAS